MDYDLILIASIGLIAISIKCLSYVIIKNCGQVCSDCKRFEICERFNYYPNRFQDRNCLEHPACKEFRRD